jgi:hypothetical protein
MAIVQWTRCLALVLPIGVGALTGCGPILSTSLIIDAESKLAAADVAEAQQFAPYEYTAADQYLKKAHEEFGYADYGPAIDYAYKAADAAEKAIKKASDEKSRRMDMPTSVPTAPASTPVSPAPVSIKQIDVAAPKQPEQP